MDLWPVSAQDSFARGRYEQYHPHAILRVLYGVILHSVVRRELEPSAYSCTPAAGDLLFHTGPSFVL